MAENSSISWCRHTWNPWIGCTKISPACDGCYAEHLMDTRLHRARWGNHPRILTGPDTWDAPYRWNRAAEKAGDRPFVFCASLADIFDNQVPPEWRKNAFDVMRETPLLVYLLLTKRPQNIVEMAKAAGGLPANAAIGTTIEDQKRADTNVPHLLMAKSSLNPLFAFVSCEPLLGPIDLRKITFERDEVTYRIDALDPLGVRSATFWSRRAVEDIPLLRIRLDWVITGGETDQGDHKARPSHPDWFRSLRDQCAAADVPFHHKQNGEWVSVLETPGVGPHFTFGDGATVRRIGKKLAGRTIDWLTHDAFPEVHERD